MFISKREKHRNISMCDDFWKKGLIYLYEKTCIFGLRSRSHVAATGHLCHGRSLFFLGSLLIFSYGFCNFAVNY